ncbi:MAG TPA: TIGR03936 family radical SAM-associated protein, partial [Thermoanaerobaculia bacterium]|nr:TIGR03936 family radical SAM-associated protein [Thermoanaerobaculia bacterium]
VLDISINKRFLRVELVKAIKEMRTEDCKWGHCYACGVPGNGEDTVLASAMPGSLPTIDPAVSQPQDPAAYREVAKGAAYRQKAMPDLPSAVRRAAATPTRVFRHRVTFEKTGDARFLSHRNTMDVLERAIRAAGLPARYSEGFNPHMKLSMGPALPLGLESRHEVFDVEGIASFGGDARRAIDEKLPSGVRVLDVRELSPAEPALSRAVKSARYAVRLESPEHIERASEVLSNGWRESVPALRALSIEEDERGTRMTFEVNLDQSAGETSTAKKVLETLLGIPPEAQASLSVTREATVLG